MTRRELGDWLVSTALVFGASHKTAYTIAGIFVGDPAITDEALAKFDPPTMRDLADQREVTP